MSKLSIEEQFELFLLNGEEDQKESGYSINDEGSAIWAAEKLHKSRVESEIKTMSLKKHKEYWVNMLNEKIKKYDQEIESIEKSTSNGNSFLEYHLSEYARKKKLEDKKYKFNHPFVKVNFSTPQAKYIYQDENAMIEFLKENEPEMVKTVAKNKTDVKKKFKLEDGEVIYIETGESVEFIKINHDKTQVAKVSY